MSNLETQISPEIVNDEFSFLLREISLKDDVKTVLEIGTGSGDGSTSAIVEGLDKNTNEDKRFFTIEISKERAANAEKKYLLKQYMRVLCGCSVMVSEYMNDKDVTDFYKSRKSALNDYPLAMVLGWKKEEIDYINTNQSSENLIERVKEDYEIPYFDLVLIDGSEFTGKAELNHVIGAKYIALDDINAAKNSYNYELLRMAGSQYMPLVENWSLRNGFAIFKKK